MCIAVFSTAHPDYALILINNRDEFLARPTKQADWWDAPHSNVLGGRDLLREEHGSWLGITREGRLAVLTNFREDGEIKPEARSRGGMVKSYLTQPARSQTTTADFVSELIQSGGLRDVGGFSLVCGFVGKPLAAFSNRTSDANSIHWILDAKGETVGLSNAVITDRSWTKVTEAESLVEKCIKESIRLQMSQDDLVEELFRVLSVDTLPRLADGMNWVEQVKELRKSIFIPAIGDTSGKESTISDPQIDRNHQPLQGQPASSNSGIGMSGLYGTQRQTIILVKQSGHVNFIERSIAQGGSPILEEGPQDVAFEFYVGLS